MKCFTGWRTMTPQQPVKCQSPIALEFMEWYNRKGKTRFVFERHDEEAPTLIFSDGRIQMRVEVATVYYDAKDAQFKWLGHRTDPNAPREWSKINFHTSLIKFINDGVVEKCSAKRGTKCLLLIDVEPTLTTPRELRNLLKEVVVPERNPFEGIYMVGHFTNAKRFGPVELVVKKVA